jgi:hypothetical protein
MPQYKNALAAPYVRRFCEKWAAADAADGHDRMKYTEHSYTTAWRLMLSNLNQVGKHYYENGIAAPASAPASASAPAPVTKSKDD